MKRNPCAPPAGERHLPKGNSASWSKTPLPLPGTSPEGEETLWYLPELHYNRAYLAPFRALPRKGWFGGKKIRGKD